MKAPYAVTKLQYKTPRGWVNLRGSKRSANARGVTVWKYYWNVTQTFRVRAVTFGNGSYTASVTGTKKVNQTAGGRVLARPAGAVAPVAPVARQPSSRPSSSSDRSTSRSVAPAS